MQQKRRHLPWCRLEWPVRSGSSIQDRLGSHPPLELYSNGLTRLGITFPLCKSIEPESCSSFPSHSDLVFLPSFTAPFHYVYLSPPPPLNSTQLCAAFLTRHLHHQHNWLPSYNWRLAFQYVCQTSSTGGQSVKLTLKDCTLSCRNGE